MKVTILGSGGFIPTRDRETSAVLVDIDDEFILFDAGSGVKHLQDFLPSSNHHRLRSLNVVLSHYHLDHVCGLTWLLRLWQAPLRLFLPTKPLVETSGLEAIQLLTSPPYFSLPLDQWPHDVELVERADSSFTIGTMTVSVLKQRHSGGSVGFRIGRFAYITDTLPNRTHTPFLQGCELVLIDAMRDDFDFDRLDGYSRTGHGHSVTNATIARAAGVERLGFIHLAPDYSSDRVHNLVAEAQSIFSGSFATHDGMILNV